MRIQRLRSSFIAIIFVNILFNTSLVLCMRLCFQFSHSLITQSKRRIISKSIYNTRKYSINEPYLDTYITMSNPLQSSDQQSNIDYCPDSLRTFLINRISKGLETWVSDANNTTGNNIIDEQYKSNITLLIANNIISNVKLINDDYKTYNKQIMDNGITISNMLYNAKIKDISLLASGDLTKLIDNHTINQANNKDIFNNIIQHHHDLKQYTEWSDHNSDLILQSSNIESYAVAATKMGKFMHYICTTVYVLFIYVSLYSYKYTLHLQIYLILIYSYIRTLNIIYYVHR